MLHRPLGKALTLAVLLLSVGTFGSKARAQYFGRNKVQYDDFQFKVLQTPHFKIYYYPQERDAVKIAASLAERWNARHEVILGHTLSGSQPLVLYASHPQFEENNIVGALGVGVGGVTEPIKRIPAQVTWIRGVAVQNDDAEFPGWV